VRGASESTQMKILYFIKEYSTMNLLASPRAARAGKNPAPAVKQTWEFTADRCRLKSKKEWYDH